MCWRMPTNPKRVFEAKLVVELQFLKEYPQFKADELADSAKSKMQQGFRRSQDNSEDVARGGKAAVAAEPKGEEQKAMLGQFGMELVRFSAVCAVVYFVGYMQVRSQFRD